jgi:hypothetical protein
MRKSDEYISKFKIIVSQTDIVKLCSTRGELEELLKVLTEIEIDELVSKNVFLVQSCAPSSRTTLKNLNVEGDLVLINIDHSYFSALSKEEVVAIILHEIGHVFNSDKQGMDAEFASDKFASEKGYGFWVIEGLKKGLNRKWMGFEETSCNQRIERLKQMGATRPPLI